MAFYKLEATYRVFSNSGSKNKKTYKYFYRTQEAMRLNLDDCLSRGASIKIKEISENEYMSGTQ